jgi:hypothetical protein
MRTSDGSSLWTRRIVVALDARPMLAESMPKAQLQATLTAPS